MIALNVSGREVEDKNLMSELVSWVRSPGRTSPNASLLAHEGFFASFIKTKAGFHYEGRGHISVRPEGLEFIEQDPHKGFRVARDRSAISELNPMPLINGADKIRDPKPYVELKLKLKNKTAWGEKVTVNIEPPLLLPVLQARMPQIP